MHYVTDCHSPQAAVGEELEAVDLVQEKNE